MNYKDRKDAKCKYKQVLLSTFATMTLGVSTLGSTSSIFAEEEEAGAQQDFPAAYSLGTDGRADNSDIVQKLGEAGEKLLKNTPVDSRVGQSLTILAGGTAEALKGKDWVTVARTLAIGSSALVPVGGVFVSPLLELLWPNTQTDPKVLIDELEKKLSTKITDINREGLTAHYQSLSTLLKQFQDSVNNTSTSGVYYDSIQAANAQVARDINQEFNKLIGACKIPTLQTELLPLYTATAAAHLEFLKFIEKNWQHPRIQMDAEAFKRYITPTFKKARADYIKYIQETYKQGEKKIYDEMEKEINAAKSQNLVPGGTKITDESVIINSLQAQINQKQDEVNLLKKINQPYSDASEKKSKIEAYLIDYKNLVWKKNTYIQTTVQNPAFSQLAQWGQVEENENMYYYNADGKKQTDWQQIGDKWYYFSTADNTTNLKGDTFKKEEMVVGNVFINGKLYQFNNSGECINPNSAIAEGTYKIKSVKNANKIIDWGAYGERPVLWDDHNGDNQKWEFKYDSGKKAYQIINKANSNVLAFNTTEGTDYTALVTHNDKKDEHYWELEDAGNGNVWIMNHKDKTMVLDINNGKEVKVKRIGLGTSGIEAQQFKLVKD